jgi:hypothetical protein
MERKGKLIEWETTQVYWNSQLGKPVLQDQQNIWLVNILLPYGCMQVQAS